MNCVCMKYMRPVSTNWLKFFLCAVLYFTVFQSIQAKKTERAITAFEDDFTGSNLNDSKWMAVTNEGSLGQDGELRFANESQSSNWDLNYIYTNQALYRTKNEQVLQLTLDVKLTDHVSFILGFIPDVSYQGYNHPQNGIKYGFDGDRLDRALWFMQDPKLTHILRMPVIPDKYQSYKLRLELGSTDGALWQYDLGRGWRTARDTRNNGTGYAGMTLRYVISSYFYHAGTLLMDNVSIKYVTPAEDVNIDPPPNWAPPINAEFDGMMDERWTNWAGDLGISTSLSTADFSTIPGWILLNGPKNGWGLYLRHYPFLPEKTFPFHAEMRLRYPVIDEPEANYMMMLCLLVDLDGNLYTDDIAHPTIVVQNLKGENITQVRVQEQVGLIPNCRTANTDLPEYWEGGDLHLRISIIDDKTIDFRYKYDAMDEWTRYFTYDASRDGIKFGCPIGCDIIGPCVGSKWPWPPPPQCKADEVSFEIDYVRFGNESNVERQGKPE